MSGLLGIGGGIVMVPLQRRVLGTPLRMAIANSATTMVVLTLFGATAKNYAVTSEGLAPWWKPCGIAAVLIPTAFVGAGFGGRLTHILPVRSVRLVFLIVLGVLGVRMVLKATSQL